MRIVLNSISISRSLALWWASVVGKRLHTSMLVFIVVIKTNNLSLIQYASFCAIYKYMFYIASKETIFYDDFIRLQCMKSCLFAP